MNPETTGASASGKPAIRLSQNAYARRIRVNPGTVNKWVKSGRITLGPDGLIDPELANRGDVNALQAEIEAFARDLLASLAAHAERKAREHLGTVAQAGPHE